MSPEEIARRHEELAGFELVDYAEVALPLWQLSVEAISVAHKSLPPIQEFVLRSFKVGLKSAEMGGFLGLSDEVLDGTLAQLLADRLIRAQGVDQDAAHDDYDFVLTTDGNRALDEEGTSIPIEEQFVLLFDGIKRIPTTIPADQISFPREVATGSIVEIAATPSSKPEVGDLPIEDVERILVLQAGDRIEFGRTLLRLKRVSRHRRVFRKAVALVFKGTSNSKDLRIKFVIGGVREEALEQRFAEGGGLARPGFIRAFSDSYLNANLRKHLGADISRAVLDGEEFLLRRRALSVAKLKLGSAIRKKARANTGDAINKEEFAPEIERAEGAVSVAEKALAELLVRPSSCYEQVEFLTQALRNARRRLIISSQGLAPWIVDKKFITNLRARLIDGLEFELRLDQLTYERSIGNPAYSTPYIELQKLAEQHRNCKVVLWREARYFHLNFDDKALLVSNRPFLSYHTRVRAFDQYSGYSINGSGLIEAYLQRIRKPA